MHNIAILCLRKMGLPATVTESLFLLLQQATRHIMTGFGLSMDGYGG
jgi:hypothetical protein